jgi:hypothetical protein
VLTPLVNFRVHPHDSLSLANNLALVIGAVDGTAQYALELRAMSFTLFEGSSTARSGSRSLGYGARCS